MASLDPRLHWHPEAFAAVAMSALERAFWLEQCRHAAAYMAVHSTPEGLTTDQLAQRKGLLTIASRLFESERDREMNRATKEWTDYREAAGV